jgi:hypothetical protein
MSKRSKKKHPTLTFHHDLGPEKLPPTKKLVHVLHTIKDNGSSSRRTGFVETLRSPTKASLEKDPINWIDDPVTMEAHNGSWTDPAYMDQVDELMGATGKRRRTPSVSLRSLLLYSEGTYTITSRTILYECLYLKCPTSSTRCYDAKDWLVSGPTYVFSAEPRMPRSGVATASMSSSIALTALFASTSVTPFTACRYVSIYRLS